MRNSLDYIDIKEVYYLETLEQLETLASRVRNRVLCQITSSPKTVAQVARDVGISRPKAHYHVMVLIKIGLVIPAYEKIVNGILEKYYIGRAHFYSYDKLFEFGEAHPEDVLFNKKLAKAANDYMLSVLDVSRDKIEKLGSNKDSASNKFVLDFGYHMTPEQIVAIMQKLDELSELAQAHHLENMKRPDYLDLPYHKLILLMVPLLPHADTGMDSADAS